jgi:hypothetical protein
MNKICLYRINLDYIKYLYMNYDNTVQYDIEKSDEYNSNRPYINVGLTINNINYYAPLKHPRPKYKSIKSNLQIIKINKGEYGVIALNNMIPVPKSLLINIDINNDPNKYLLWQQFHHCNKKRFDIYNRANMAYKRRVDDPIESICKTSCDFKLLEIGLMNFCEEHDISHL